MHVQLRKVQESDKKFVCFSMIRNIFKDYIVVPGGAKYTSHLTYFRYSALELRFHCQEKNSIKFDNYPAVQTGGKYTPHLIQFCY